MRVPAPRLVACSLIVLAAACGLKKRYALSSTELLELGTRRLEAGRHLKAREVLERCRSDYPASPEATRAQILIADSFYRQSKYEEAAVEYRLFLDFHPASHRADYALFRLGLCKYHRNPGPDRDLTVVYEGIEEFEKLLRLYPDSSHVPDAREKKAELERVLLEHDLHVARFYLKTHRWSGAISRYEKVLETTDDPQARAEAEAGIAEARPYQEEADRKRAEWMAERAEKLARDAAREAGREAGRENGGEAAGDREGAETPDDGM